MSLGSGIRNKNLFRILDPGAKRHRIRIRNTAFFVPETEIILLFSLYRGWYRDRIMIFCQKIWYFRSRLVLLAFEFSNAPLMSYCDRYFLPIGEIIFVRDFS
jgi:hypothetical protein